MKIIPLNNILSLETPIPLLLLIIMISAPTIFLAYGSNDSSYKFGYKVATDNLTGLITVPSTPWNKNPDISEICDSGDGCPAYDDALENYCLTGQNDKVTNSTACIDGYVQAWKDWCIGNHYKNANYCAKLVVDGDFPMSFIKDKEMLATMPLGSMLFGTTWNYINESNGHGISTQGSNIITSAAQIQKAATNVINHEAKTLGSQYASLWNNPTFIMSNITKFSGK
jgi:hypothetical protein